MAVMMAASWRMHIDSEPSILYFGTPVLLISTLNEDGTVNAAPMSSAWWLGWTACWVWARKATRQKTYCESKNAF